MDTISVKPSELKALVLSILKSGGVPYVQGPPGLGKSAMIRQLADDQEYNFQDIRLTYLDPTHLQGFLTIVDGMACWTQPADFPTSEMGKVLRLYDELSSAPRAVQCAAYQLLLDRKVGKFALPDDTWQVGAGNRAVDRSIVNQMGAAMRSRLITITLEPDKDDLVTYAIQAGWAEEVIAFLNFSPSSVYNFDAKKWDGESAFACPRTWEFVSKMIPHVDRSMQFRAIAGAVGSEESAKFGSFIRVFKDLPDFKEIYASPETATVPIEPSVVYAVCAKLAISSSKKNLDATLTYAKRLPTEFNILVGRDIFRAKAALRNEPAMIKFYQDNTGLILGD